MAAVQLMCARLGMVTGRGLAAVVRQRYPRWVLWGACLLLIVANVINIGADLGGMAEASEMVTGIPARWWMPVYAVLIVAPADLDLLPHDRAHLQMAHAGAVRLRDHGVPGPSGLGPRCCAPRSSRDIQWSSEYLSVLVAILGTTHLALSVLLAGRAGGGGGDAPRARHTVAERQGATDEELRRARTDVLTGMFFSNLVMYFIILTTAATLHAHGITKIATAQQAAEALEAARRQRRVLAVHAWADRHRDAGRAGAGGVERLRDLRRRMAWRGSLDRKP